MRNCPKCKRSFDDHDFRVCPVDGAELTQDTPIDPMIGRVLDGRFRIVEIIGQGGMGAVYKAVHTQMDRICAIKLLSPVSNDREDAIARFRREARMTSRINSPNAVIIYDFGEAEPGLLYIAMEYIEGESLADLLEREHFLPIDRVVNITSQVVRALTAAHSLGIVHRDLKPANIMVTRKENQQEVVKVLDFGIAKAVADLADNLTQTGLLLGTPTYMSPEQVLGEGVDSRSDLFSLAIIVYQMLSGHLPFAGDNLRAVMMKRVHGEPTPLRERAPSVPGAVEAVVMSGLSRDPRMRSTDVQEFATALIAAAGFGTERVGPVFTVGDKNIGQTPSAAWLEETRIAQDEGELESGQHSISANRPESQARPQSSQQLIQQPTLVAPPANLIPRPSPSETILAPSAREFADQPSPVAAPPAPPSGTPSNAQWQPNPISAVSAAQQGQRSRSKLPYVLVAAFVMIIIVAGVGGVGYFLYHRSQQTTTDRAGDEGNAAAHYQAGKSLQEQASSLAQMGTAKEAADKNGEAIAEYRKALESRPDFPEAHENLGVALYVAGKPAEAVAEYEIAIKQYQTPSSQVHTNHGMALLALKRYREAADAFAQALVLKPNDADLYYYSGFALHFAGDDEGSKSAFTKYLQVAPQGEHAKDVKEILQGHGAPTLGKGSNR